MLVLPGLQLTRIIRKLSGRYRLLSANVVRTTNNLPSLLLLKNWQSMTYDLLSKDSLV
jgi:hypothetical protein